MKSVYEMKINQRKIFEIVFEADTPAGKIFDVALLVTILLSVFVVILESVSSIRINYMTLLKTLEWIFTVIFILEYIVRIIVTHNRLRYIFSFFGLIDLLSILPAFLAIFVSGAHSLLIIRTFRLLRIFRILKISRYTNAGRVLTKALTASKAKIGVFLFAVLTIVVFLGTLMYLIEGEENGFTSIPKSIYYTIVTLTTVGFGDITPKTTLGQFVSSIVMILGYAILAVPTGIISVEIAKSANNTHVCSNCMESGHDDDALFCKRCGEDIKSMSD